MHGCSYIEEFVLTERAAGKTVATMRNHERALRVFSDWLVERGQSEERASRTDLVAFVNTLIGKRKPEYINQYISALRVYFRWLLEEELIRTNPALRLKHIFIPVRPVEALTAAECKKLVRWATMAAPRDRFSVHRSGVLALLLLDTGLRLGEALGLKLDDLDWEGSKMLVRAPKTADFRVLPLSMLVRKHLRRYLHRREQQLARHGVESVYVFVSEKGKTCDVPLMAHCFPYVAKAAGIRHVYPHLLRHTFATQSLLNGAPLPAVMRLGGWKRLATVQRYTYMTDEVAAQVHAQTSPLSKL